MGNYDFWWFDVVWVYYFYVERECCKFCFSSVDVDSEFIYCVDVCCCIYVINVKWYSWLKWKNGDVFWIWDVYICIKKMFLMEWFIIYLIDVILF